MPTPQSRFTFFHPSLAVEGVQVTEPGGWSKVVISLTRSDSWLSLVKFFKGNFMWFGDAMDIIKTLRTTYGYNFTIRITIDISFKKDVWINLFDGSLKIPKEEETLLADRDNYIMTVPIVQDDFWVKFNNRFEHSVNLEGTVDVEGNAITPIAKITLPMPSQKVRAIYSGKLNTAFTVAQGAVVVGDYIQLDFDDIVSEISEKFNLGSGPNNSIPGWNFGLTYKGRYRWQATVEMSVRQETSTPPACAASNYAFVPTGADFDWILQINDTVYNFAKVDSATYTTYTIDEDFPELQKNDRVRIYCKCIGDFTDPLIYENVVIWGEDNSETFIWEAQFVFNPLSGGFCEISTDSFETQNIGNAPSGNPIPTFLDVTSDTVYEDTETDAYLIKDALKSIVTKITCQDNAIKSDFLDTCKGRRAVFRGKHLRGWPFADKPFSMSMKEWKEAYFPLLNMGAGYIVDGGVKKIEFEERSHFFNPVPVVNIPNVGKVIRRWDLERIYKTLKVGYKDGLGSESASGIDDPQTSHYYSNDNNEGKDLNILIDIITASLAIERSRRNRKELNTDDKNDEKLMSVCLEQGEDTPEFGTVFNAITNLINSDFRINVRDSVSHVFNRWKKWLNGTMLYSITGIWKFERGEGNFSMTSQFETSDCEATDDPEPVVDEGADIPATDDLDYVPAIYECPEVPMEFETFQQIDENKNNAIGISRTDSGFIPMHILDLGLELNESKASLLLLQATEQELV